MNNLSNRNADTFKTIESHGKKYTVTLSGTYYPADTDIAAISAMEYARLSDHRVRVFIGYTEAYRGQGGTEGKPGEVWPQEYDVTGYIGRTTGQVKSPILLHSKASSGGGIISADCLLGLRLTTGACAWLYKHPNFDLGVWEVKDATGCKRDDGNHFEVFHNNKVHARFNTAQKAINFIAFMEGERGHK